MFRSLKQAFEEDGRKNGHIVTYRYPENDRDEENIAGRVRCQTCDAKGFDVLDKKCPFLRKKQK